MFSFFIYVYSCERCCKNYVLVYKISDEVVRNVDYMENNTHEDVFKIHDANNV